MVFYIILAILIALVVISVRFLNKHKLPPVSCVTLVTGGVKSGKSSFAVWYCVYETFKRRLRARWFNIWHKSKKEMPLLYANIPLKCKFARKLTIDLILRKERFAYGSVAYVNEASLLADSKMFRDEELNEILMQLNKLFGHETLGGLLMYDTQSLDDCHYAIKRCVAEYVHLDGKKNFAGLLVNYRRMKLCGEGSIDVNVFDGKEEERPSVWIPFIVWHFFDAYCYSILTDNLPVSNVRWQYGESLKCSEILTLNRAREQRLYSERKKQENKELTNDVKELFR